MSAWQVLHTLLPTYSCAPAATVINSNSGSIRMIPYRHHSERVSDVSGEASDFTLVPRWHAAPWLSYDRTRVASTGFLALLDSPVVRRRLRIAAVAAAVLIVAGSIYYWWRTRPAPGRVEDEARRASFTGFTAPAETFFQAMDGGVDLATDEAQGRNLWMVYSGGNDRFWDWLARESGGTFDLLKI